MKRWIIAAVAAIVAVVVIYFFANIGGGQPPQPPQPLTVTGAAPAEINEGDSVSITCTASSGVPIVSVRIQKDRGNGTLLGDTNPAPDTADNPYNARKSGKSHEALFTCLAEDRNGNTLGDQMSMIVRETKDPEWDGNPPEIPANGSDGQPAGKVGVPFDVTVKAKDTAPGPGVGVPSGIYRIHMTSTDGLVIDNSIRETAGRPKGPPDNNVGPFDLTETFTVTCPSSGDKSLNIEVRDTVENNIDITLPVECWEP